MAGSGFRAITTPTRSGEHCTIMAIISFLKSMFSSGVSCSFPEERDQNHD